MIISYLKLLDQQNIRNDKKLNLMSNNIYSMMWLRFF